MLKGDLKKQAILETAEKLFFEKGYSSATIDDILEILGCSKGSLYHHFDSKQQILRDLCVSQAASAYKAYGDKSFPDTMSAFNSLLYHGLMVRTGQERLLSTLLPLYGTNDGDLMIASLIHAQEALFLPEVRRLLDLLKEEKQAFWNLPLLPDLVWHTYASLYGSMIAFANDLMAGSKQPGGIVAILEAARFIFERTLDLPYGSMEIIRADEALNTINQALKHNRYLNS